MTETAEQIDAFLKHVRILAENQREILLGETDEASDVTTTQGHVLMLLAQNGPQTNSELAHALVVSPAAITKVMKHLQHAVKPMVTQVPDDHDGRISRWALTAHGISLAQVHARRHAQTLEHYQQLLMDFDTDEQATIARFLQSLEQCLMGDETDD
ncbi:MarR family transcriptional regulator [Weissella halotolerans]|uniref:Multiple antibiotic resistance operon transcriptional repressor MarR n=1 Tax=Weissella halotolerans DSM 20190 TaxID=1123500 RepID=A0A0R2G627_9LACO|nr:MarR family transcriptional regulator [Weissella halotolerans]KRN32228.1 multiple antibiotic resistance operon transcriptional repressor MarR [Weissella halotolerans DSM 20190]